MPAHARRRQRGCTAPQPLGRVITVYFLAFGLLPLPGGRLVDRFGGRRGAGRARPAAGPVCVLVAAAAGDVRPEAEAVGRCRTM
ncbi:hypothetical protein ACQP2P_22985 [Dactylosporangium sp. CA-139114]|uniref:hypothetical protein n=1 Tax=Dactylosporangium sp. CA-139114 TaxID=3239931 RepID=UPI003D952045